MRKIVICIIAVGLVFLVGCASELVYFKGYALYKIEDKGSFSSSPSPEAITVQPPQGGNYSFPDVSPNAEKIAFVCSTSGQYYADICTAKLDGTAATKIVTGPGKGLPRWYPDNTNIAYYDSSAHSISRTPSGSLHACSSLKPCYGGFDLYAGGTKLVFSQRESGSIDKLHWKSLSDGSFGDILPLPPSGILDANVDESYPVVSFDGKMLASKVQWPGLEGIRMRAMDDNGDWGGPFTMKLTETAISGIAFSHDDNKVYFSAVPNGGSKKALYLIELSNLMSGILSAMTASPPPVQNVTPTLIRAESEDLYWPSGINK